MKSSIDNNTRQYNRENFEIDVESLTNLFSKLSINVEKNIIPQLFEIEISSEIVAKDHIYGYEEVTSNRTANQIELSLASGDLQAALWDYANVKEVQHYSHGRFVPADSCNFISRLPPVLNFQIGRFVGNKMDFVDYLFDHSIFTFPEQIALDPYLYENREVTNERREIIQFLRQEQNTLKDQLSKISNYNGKKISLDVILSSTIQFIQDSIGKSQDPQEIEQLQLVVAQLLEDSLSVSKQIENLRSNINELQKQIDSQFDDLNNQIYYLHSILVHEGKYNSGSSWAFIYNQIEQSWYKFYDSLVEKVEKDIVFSEAFGVQNAHLDQFSQKSAYSLIFISDQLRKEITPESFMVSFAPKMKLFIENDNKRYRKEIEQEEQKKLQASESLVDQFIRLLKQKEKEFMESYKLDENASNLQIKSFKHFLESIDHHPFVQYKLADHIHKNLFGFNLVDHDDIRVILANKGFEDLVLISREKFSDLRSLKFSYSQACRVLGFFTEGLNLWLNKKFVYLIFKMIILIIISFDYYYYYYYYYYFYYLSLINKFAFSFTIVNNINKNENNLI